MAFVGDLGTGGAGGVAEGGAGGRKLGGGGALGADDEGTGGAGGAAGGGERGERGPLEGSELPGAGGGGAGGAVVGRPGGGTGGRGGAGADVRGAGGGPPTGGGGARGGGLLDVVTEGGGGAAGERAGGEAAELGAAGVRPVSAREWVSQYARMAGFSPCRGLLLVEPNCKSAVWTHRWRQFLWNASAWACHQQRAQPAEARLTLTQHLQQRVQHSLLEAWVLMQCHHRRRRR